MGLGSSFQQMPIQRQSTFGGPFYQPQSMGYQPMMGAYQQPRDGMGFYRGGPQGLPPLVPATTYADPTWRPPTPHFQGQPQAQPPTSDARLDRMEQLLDRVMAIAEAPRGVEEPSGSDASGEKPRARKSRSDSKSSMTSEGKRRKLSTSPSGRSAGGSTGDSSSGEDSGSDSEETSEERESSSFGEKLLLLKKILGDQMTLTPVDSIRRKKHAFSRSAGATPVSTETEQFQLTCPSDYATSLQEYYLELRGEIKVSKKGPKGPLPPGTFPKPPTCSSRFYEMADCPLDCTAPSFNPGLITGDAMSGWPTSYPVKVKSLMEWETMARTLFHATTYADTVNLALQERLKQWADSEEAPSSQDLQELSELSSSGGKALQQTMQSLSYMALSMLQVRREEAMKKVSPLLEASFKETLRHSEEEAGRVFPAALVSTVTEELHKINRVSQCSGGGGVHQKAKKARSKPKPFTKTPAEDTGAKPSNFKKPKKDYKKNGNRGKKSKPKSS